MILQGAKACSSLLLIELALMLAFGKLPYPNEVSDWRHKISQGNFNQPEVRQCVHCRSYCGKPEKLILNIGGRFHNSLFKLLLYIIRMYFQTKIQANNALKSTNNGFKDQSISGLFTFLWKIITGKFTSNNNKSIFDLLC